MVLLDPSFQNTHCFWASHGLGANQNMIGVYFMPVIGMRTNDIRGVFWIDAGTYELKRLDFLYTQIAPAPEQQVAAGEADSTVDSDPGSDVAPGYTNPEPGGSLDFSRLPDGSFIIPSWRIFVNDTWTQRAVPGEKLPTPRQGKETGGLVLRIEPRRPPRG
jgi:hypothetical protein